MKWKIVQSDYLDVLSKDIDEWKVLINKTLQVLYDPQNKLTFEDMNYLHNYIENVRQLTNEYNAYEKRLENGECL